MRELIVFVDGVAILLSSKSSQSFFVHVDPEWIY